MHFKRTDSEHKMKISFIIASINRDQEPQHIPFSHLFYNNIVPTIYVYNYAFADGLF